MLRCGLEVVQRTAFPQFQDKGSDYFSDKPRRSRFTVKVHHSVPSEKSRIAVQKKNQKGFLIWLM